MVAIIFMKWKKVKFIKNPEIMTKKLDTCSNRATLAKIGIKSVFPFIDGDSKHCNPVHCEVIEKSVPSNYIQHFYLLFSWQSGKILKNEVKNTRLLFLDDSTYKKFSDLIAATTKQTIGRPTMIVGNLFQSFAKIVCEKTFIVTAALTYGCRSACVFRSKVIDKPFIRKAVLSYWKFKK